MYLKQGFITNKKKLVVVETNTTNKNETKPIPVYATLGCGVTNVSWRLDFNKNPPKTKVASHSHHHCSLIYCT